MRLRLFLGWCSFIAVLGMTTGSALATFPGEDGKIVFVDNGGIYTIDPDGTARTQLTTGGQGFDYAPAWSADGREIAFTRQYDDANNFTHREIWTMNANGSGQGVAVDGASPGWSPDGRKIVFARIGRDTEGGGVFILDRSSATVTKIAPGFRDSASPEWSPDGQTIAFTSATLGSNPSIWTVLPDGTGLTRISPPPTCCDGDAQPSWSPDGSRIAFSRINLVAGSDVWTMSPTGADRTALLATSDEEGSPAWSPSGTRIVFQGVGSSSIGLRIMNSDGSGAIVLSSNGAQPDWGPVPYAAYVRPKGASPVYAPFVPAYEPCESPNRQHAPPLDFGSCAPPTPTSAHLTVGTPPQDPANSVGSLRARGLVGDPGTPQNEADVELTVGMTDVRDQGSLADYSGELEARVPLRITDKASPPPVGGPNVSATVSDAAISFAASCAPTIDTTIGSTCSVATSANGLMPGSVIEGNRSIWELEQLRLYDGGADQLASTTGDNTLFMTQGIFVP
jgi:WD40-like Beta Propeller Repeat